MNPNTPFFSIIIPLFNKELYIKKTLDSVFKQTVQDYEIIIVNDGSTDDSLKLCKEYNVDNMLIIDQKNQGAPIARNNGITKAAGKYIAFLDADDFWHQNHLQEFKNSIDLYENESIFCNNYEINFSAKKNKKTSFSNFNENKNQIVFIEDYFKNSLYNDIAWTSAVCVKKSTLLSGYYFDSEIISGHDTDLWIRLALRYNFVFNKTVTAIHNKYILNSLSKTNHSDSRFKVTQKYLIEESKHFFLKKYMDQNRFAIALQYKLNGNSKKLTILKNQILSNNLNWKQTIALQLPTSLLKYVLKAKSILMRMNIYLSIFK
ncbi:glycosyltransferase family 2 protein [Aquimarina agarivorans]|uniref:glycosyltransferase family 2 protein n=1 Tax=Aquimarina agarivorans TaxID=980584 RepID=UPI000248E98C|nr:glycosyltransferase family 2 protein [Aquimarina agarivorans]